jgi:predicted NAD/FAD-dependent oxidoreductase
MTVIVGAGLCGLWLGNRLKNKNEPFCIIEKSRGVGGRMATRRTERAKWDHGAQFYSLQPSMTTLHERWRKAGLVKEWFQTEGSVRYCSPSGMTALAKNLAMGLDVRCEQRVTQIQAISSGWNLQIENSKPLSAQSILLTCPLPQSLDLLENSGIQAPLELRQVRYAKALVALFEDVRTQPEISFKNGFIEEPQPSRIFSIADQYVKGLSQVPAWTVTMNPEFSEQFFETDEASVLREIESDLKNLAPFFEYRSVQLKKWRYSHPLNPSGTGYAKVAEGLYLAGDGLARPSLLGAISSAESLSKILSNP